MTDELLHFLVPLDCCSNIILTLGNSIKNNDSNQVYEGNYTFSGFINGMDYFVHSSEQTAIWYYENSYGYHWIIGPLTNLGNFVATLFSYSELLKNKCPMNNGYVWSWIHGSDDNFEYTDEIYLKCENEDDFCTPENPCGEDQGDCDTHDECQDGLVCGSNNCPVSLGFDSEVDCCTLPGLCTTFSELFLLCIEFDELQV